MMFFEKKVSICCTTYNQERYIRQCLDGFLMQKTDFAFELLIHDDASTDSTNDIVLEYEKKYPDIIRVVCQTENQYSKGVQIPETYLYPIVRGEFVAFCEGDDYWIDPYKLQKQVDFLEKNSEYGFVHTNYVVVDENNKRLQKINHKWASGNVLMDILYRNYHISTPTVMFRYSLYKEIESSLSKKPIFKMGDLPMWIEFAYRSKVKYIHDPMVAYRVLDESASHSKSLEYIYDFYKSALDIRWFYEKKFNLHLNHNVIEEGVYKTMIKESYLKRDYKNALFYFGKAANSNKANLVNPRNLLFLLGSKFYLIRRIIIFFYKLYL